MSGSPTAAEIRLREAERRRLEEERRRRAEEERRRREEAERRARIALANRLRTALQAESARLQSEVAELRRAAADARLDDSVPDLEARIAGTVRDAGEEPETISAALGRVRGLAQRVARARGQVEERRRARARETNELTGTLQREADELRREIANLRSRTAERGGAVGHVEPRIDEVVASVGRSPETASSALQELRALAKSIRGVSGDLDREAARVSAEREALRREAALEAQALSRLDSMPSDPGAEEQRTRLELAQGALRVRIAGIEADEVAMTWSGDEVREVSAAIDALGAAADPEQAAAALAERLDRALSEAQDRQLAEERRAYVVQSLQDGLRKQGFQVSDAVLIGADLQGEVAFRAVRADNRWVDVNVPVEGHVFYDVDGTDRVTERGDDGLVYTSCDETEARLEALHQDLNERFGIEAGELFWESKDPNRRQRNAQDLPAGGPAAKQERGGR